MASLESQLKAYAGGTGNFKSSKGNLNWKLTELAKKAGYTQDYFDQLESERQTAAKKQKKSEEDKTKDKRSGLSKAWDTVNFLDSGRSWTTNKPSAEQAKKGVLTQLSEGVGSTYTRVGEATGETINQFANGDKQQRDFQQGQDVLQSVIDRATERLKDKNLPADKRKQFEKLRAETIKSRDKLYGQRSQRLDEVIERTDPLKGAAAVGSVAFDLATLGTGAAAVQAGKQTAKQVAKRVATGAVEGAISGGLNAVEQRGRDTTLLDVAKGAGLGTLIGGGLVAGGAGLNKATSSVRDSLAANNERGVIQIVNNTNKTKRYIKPSDAEYADAVAKIDNARVANGDANNGIAGVKLDNGDVYHITAKTPAEMEARGFKSAKAKNTIPPELEPEVMYRGESPNRWGKGMAERGEGLYLGSKRLAGLQKDGTVLNDGIHSYKINPNAKLLQEGAAGSEYSKLRSQAYKEAGTKGVNKRFTELVREAGYDGVRGKEEIVVMNPSVILESSPGAPQFRATQPTKGASTSPKTSSATVEPSPTLAGNVPGRSQAILDNGVPRAAQRTEALAIESGLADSGFDLQPTAKMNMADQADKALNVINTDYEAAKRIALGEVDAPGDLRASVMYEAVKQRAVKDGDSALLYKLAKESSVPTAGKEAGQFIKGFDYKNPSDPTVAMKEILDARAKSKVKDIPKDLTPEEADTLTKMAQDVADKKAAILDGGDRLDYGEALVKMRRYKNDLIDATKSFKEKNAPRGLVTATFGTLKSLKSSLDNSFFGRQGFKVLTTHPKAWGKAFVKSWGDIAMGISGKDALDVLDADILSRPNAVSGIYKKMGLDVSAIEDAFPSSLPEKIPGFGRVFKASEYAYTGAAHRMRADLADQLLDKAQRAGVDITDKKQLESLGKLINSMTGRGHLGKAEGGADMLNNLFFSARNWKANFDTITAHQLQKDVSPFVRREAAVNLLKMIAATSAVMTAASAWKPGSVEWDPRSSNFGKIKIGNTRFEMTGGMASIATIASRIATQETKSSTSDRITKLNSDEFGARSTWDVLMDYTEGKMSPGAQVIKQLMTGKDFVGNAVTPASIAKDALMPLPVSNYQELKNDPKSANIVLSMIADGLGIGTNTYSANKDWNQVNTKRIQGFKKTVDAETFATANNDFNEEYNRWFEDVRRDERYKRISEDMRKTLINQKKQDLTDTILERYGYKYKQEKKQSGDKKTLNELKDL